MHFADNLVSVTIDPLGGGTGSGAHVRLDMPEAPLDTMSDIERRVEMLLAGRAAEIECLGQASSGAGGSENSDLARAMHLLAAAHLSLGMTEIPRWRCQPGEAVNLLRLDPKAMAIVEADLARLAASALALVRGRRAEVEALADELLSRVTLSAAEVLAIIGAAAARTNGSPEGP